ncbi:MOSC domain-containing protein [Phaeovulum sp.]|uniref:MOSC domain-containing protein n=1 Tax=Phaeovulum sp. TaxID=2934796 RepID=UPI0039E24167
MPALLATKFSASVVWLGRVIKRETALASVPVDRLWCSFDGPEGEDHAGMTRPSCSRMTQQYPLGTTIRNTRQMSIISEEELIAIAAEMGLETLAPEWLGATVVLRGLPALTQLPPSSRLQVADGVTLVVDMENRPCTLVSRVIETHRPGFGARFKPAATARRGVTAWVEREGALCLGDTVRLHVPDQPVWPHLAAARAD